MDSTLHVNSVLVNLDVELLDPEAAAASRLIQQTIKLAQASGCRVELFYVSHSASIDQRLFADDAQVEERRTRLADENATCLSEIALHLQSHGITVTVDARWDTPEADAILRKIDHAQPDLVLLRSHAHSYFFGILANTDWELVRRSPADLWFVKDEGIESNDVLSAIGTVAFDDDIISASDYHVFQLANRLAAALGGTHECVHTYAVPAGVPGYDAYVPDIGGVAPLGAAQLAADLEASQRRIARAHGDAIQRFAQECGIDRAKIALIAGSPETVLPTLAHERGVGMIVMGARHLNRWQRVRESVSAEPVLADTPCDVVFVKSHAGVSIRHAEQAPSLGHAELDVEKAIIDPAASFSSPAAVALTDSLSVALRQRILQAWALDEHAKMVAADEGGPLVPLNKGVFDQITAALEELETHY
ncbi:MAG: nucleotide-binding universal stress UspA family protein [Gammaproteobacteria bacterium]|jgi:nucleotide-binding universal stress UspA family protein